jgi:glycosyltransferase involved in cell wall biosynthesis
MKIAYLCSDIDVQVYGHEGCSVHIREFTNALAEEGHDVFIICAWAGEARFATRARVYELQPAGMDAAVWSLLESEPLIQDNHLERDLRSVLWSYWLLERGAEILQQEKPDFIYERYALFGCGGLELGRRLGLPVVLEVNAPLCDQQAGYEKFTLMRAAAELEKRILAGADAVIALSSWLKDWAILRGSDPTRVHIVPDGVSDRLFGELPDGASVRARHHLGGKRVVGFVGSFHWWHDVSTLLSAFAELHGEDPDLRLLLVGDGERRRKVLEQARGAGIEDAVVFTGKVPHEEVAHHIAAMDVAVVPYVPLDDFFFSPMKLFECMASGRPTVATALGQIEEVIEHGTTGWLYPAGDGSRLAEGLRTLLRDRVRAARIGEAGRRRVLEGYTWRLAARRIMEIVSRVIANRRPLEEIRCV